MLASAMAAGSLAACGSDSGTTDTKSTSGESSTDTAGSGNTEKTSDGKTKISIYHASWMLANPDSAQVQKVQDAYNNSDIVLDSENFAGEVIEIEQDQQFCSDYDDSYEHID